MAGKPGNRFAHIPRGTQKAPGHMQTWGSIHVKTQPAKKMPLAATARFSHPDYTVGSGITPDQPPKGSSRTLPPVGNHTLPRRLHALLVLIIADFSGLDKWFFLQFTRQAPELVLPHCCSRLHTPGQNHNPVQTGKRSDRSAESVPVLPPAPWQSLPVSCLSGVSGSSAQ